MDEMPNEGRFQEWVQQRFTSMGGHVHDHRYSFMPDVPDLSASVEGKDYWLELKFGKFRLGHDKYDDFRWEITRGQLNWLENRARTGSAVCGILGYMNTGPHVHYLCYMTATDYLKWVWQRSFNVGALLLGPATAQCALVRTGPELLAFIAGALGGPVQRPGATRPRSVRRVQRRRPDAD